MQLKHWSISPATNALIFSKPPMIAEIFGLPKTHTSQN